jgi:hypothetical protein
VTDRANLILLLPMDKFEDDGSALSIPLLSLILCTLTTVMQKTHSPSPIDRTTLVS